MPGPTVARCLSQRELSEPRLDPTGARVAFGAAHDGVGTLRIVELGDGSERSWPLSPAPALGRGMSGGCFRWLPDGTGIVYAAKDGGLWQASLMADATAVETCRVDTHHEGAFGALHGVALSDDARFVAAVDSLTSVVVVERATGVTRKVVHQHAFSLDPVWHGDTVYWQSWSPPHMPWDEAEIWCATAPDFRARRIAALPGVSLQQVAVSVADELGVMNDATGRLRPGVLDGGMVEPLPLSGEPCDCAGAQWGGGSRSWCWSPDGTRYLVARNLAGFGDLGVVDRTSGAVTTLARAVHGAVSWTPHGIVALRSGAVTPTQVVFFDPVSFERRVLATSEMPCDDGPWSACDLVEPTTGAIDGIPFRLYEPNDASEARQLFVWVHGGPTDQWQVTFMPRIAHWVGRGCRVLVVDHRGTTGHGRAFQQALNGHWGEFDTADVITVAEHAHAQGWGVPSRTVVIGGSAGGFASLNAAGERPDLFAGVVALYPVVDLADATERSWHYEQHSIAILVGDSAANTGLYHRRSPLSKLDKLSQVKVLLMHGDHDEAVPLDHSVLIADQLRRRGGDVALHVFKGEGHGFRLRANQEREYALIGEFLQTL
ncbi:MAG: prolyl oligopeptidase family serine peptidase [Acidobacteria bacterium]|nr:prolyl oligopeptidase family serine peptidase [Acidobacteriota bacterium]